MKLSNAQSSYNVYDTPQSVILNKLQNVKISEESFIRFGDKNNITNGLRALYLTKKSGYPLDKFAVNYLQVLDEYDEKEKMELVIETMIQFDSRKKIDDFFKALKPEKYVKPVNKDVDLKKTKPCSCLVKASLKKMSREQLRAELNDLIKSPSAYFGALLEVDECKVDLFTVNNKQQIELAKQMLAQLDSEEKQKTDKPKISIGKQKPLNLGYGETLKAQSGYNNLKSQSKQTPIMAAKKPTGKAVPRKKGMTTRKPSKAGSIAQQKAQARIRRISEEATRIQNQGGKKTIPAKSVFKVNRADAVKKAAKTVK